MEVIILLAVLIFVAAFIFGLFCIVDKVKDKEPRNKVRFFVEKEVFNSYFLYIGNKDVMCYICSNDFFKKFGLNPDDFADMKDDEIREVFINLED